MVNQINENVVSACTMINISVNSRGLKRVRMRKLKIAFLSEKHFLPNSYYPREKFIHVHMLHCFTCPGVERQQEPDWGEGRQGAGVLWSKSSQDQGGAANPSHPPQHGATARPAHSPAPCSCPLEPAHQQSECLCLCLSSLSFWAPWIEKHMVRLGFTSDWFIPSQGHLEEEFLPGTSIWLPTVSGFHPGRLTLP